MKSILSTIFTGTKVYKHLKRKPSLSKDMLQWGMNTPSTHARKKGFSLIELMLTTVGILILSAVSYKVIRTQNIFQISAIEENQRQNVANSALDQFKRDANKIDPNWVKLGVPSVFPHPGYAKGTNFYLSTEPDADAGLSDAVTFLTTRADRSGVYRILHNISDPAPETVDAENRALFNETETNSPNEWINIEPDDVKDWSGSFSEGDWVLVYRKGAYALGIVSDTDRSPISMLRIKLDFPNESAIQGFAENANYQNSGIVNQSGVVVGSYDYAALIPGAMNLTSDNADDFIEFSKNETFLQVVQPVTYALEWLTQNGGPFNGINNGYVLDSQGNEQLVLVRSQYVYNGAENAMEMQYENLAKVTELGFTYDMMISENNAGNQSLDGYLAGEIARDVGRQSGAEPIGFMSLAEYDEAMVSDFLATSNIVGIRMMVANKWQERDKTLVAENDIKIALDPTFRDVQFQEDHFKEAKSTTDMHANAGLSATQHIGQPLYFKGPNGQEGNIVLPVMDLTTDLTTEGSPSEGKLVFLDRDGQPVTSDEGTSTVNIGDTDHQFYPTEVSTIERDGKTFIVATGMGIDSSDGSDVRKPMMATIDISAGGNMGDFLSDASGSGTMCSLAGCQLHIMDVQAQDTSLKDTVNGFIEYNGELYMSSMTKDNGDMQSVKLYKTNVDASGSEPTVNPFEEVNLNSAAVNDQRVVSAIGNETISYDGHDYLPVCMSRSIPQCSTPLAEEEAEAILASEDNCLHFARNDGAVYLYDMAGVASPIKVADHNYLCTALQNVGDNILVGGRLVTQIIHERTLTDILSGVIGPGDYDFPKLYTDEVYDASEYPYHYADAYYPYSVNFQDEDSSAEYASAITWNSGTMVELFADGRLGLALGNREIPQSGNALNVQGVITMDMDPGGMQDRIFSNIRTELANLNTSQVSNIYHQGNTSFSTDVVLPGVLYGGTTVSPLSKPGSPQLIPNRTTPMVLPLIADGAMSEGQWKDFFLDYYDPADRAHNENYNVDVPDVGPPGAPCSDSIPVSCQLN